MSSTTPPRAWRCVVCGYVHRGDAPPEVCPVCGAPDLDFAPAAQAAAAPEPAAAAPVSRRWRCLVCGYVHEGPAPPDECPLCGAPASEFEAEADAPAVPVAPARLHLVVIGAGAAGLAAAEAARRAAPDCHITVLSREPELPYYRINLTRYLAGEVTRDQLPLHPAAWYEEQRVELRLDAEVERLDLDARQVVVRAGAPIAFDRLVVASGARPFVPPIPGAAQHGVVTLRTVADADRLLAAARAGARVACVGGGLLGLEAAVALARRGAVVTVLEGAPHLMPAQLDPRAGALLAGHLAAAGVTVLAPVRVAQLRGGGTVTGVALDDGSIVGADVVLLATGVRAETSLAAAAGLAVGKGVVVDDRMRTSRDGVFAAGDAAELGGLLYGSWFVAQQQGAVAGANAVGADTSLGEVPRAHTLKVVGLETFSIGRFVPADAGDVAVAGERDGAYASFVFRDGRLVGANLLGSVALAAAVRRAIEGHRDFSVLLDRHPSAWAVAELLGG